jgi:hypothetical protein
LWGRGSYRTFKKEGSPFLAGGDAGKPLLVVIIDVEKWKRFHGRQDLFQQNVVDFPDAHAAPEENAVGARFFL